MSDATAITPPKKNHRAKESRIRRTIHTGATLSAPYLISNALATVVAAYGLLSNSTAVVIGAMLIAALMGPILGLALATVDGDTDLMKKSAIAEALGAALVLGIGLLLGRLHFAIPLTDEILARTKPNLLDLFIALAGGAAAAYATVTPRLAAGLVGVAISTALVPPLTACGICLSRGLPSLGAGAFLLFATNLVAIQGAASLVLIGLGFHNITTRDRTDRSYLPRLAVSAGLIIALGVFLTIQLKATLADTQFEREVRQELEANVRRIPGAFLYDVRFRRLPDRDIVVGVVHVPNSIDPATTRRFEALLPSQERRPIELHLRSVLTKETTADGYLFQIDPLAEPVDDLTNPVNEDGSSSNEEGQSDPTRSMVERGGRGRSK